MVRYLKGDPVQNILWRRELERKAKELNVLLVFHETPEHYLPDNACMRVGHNVWECKRPTIEVGCEYNNYHNELTVTTVLHEYGHVIDLRRFRNSMMDLLRVKGTLEMEVSAWENAFRLSKDIGYSNYSAMYEDALDCLKGYFTPPIYFKADETASFKGTPPTWEEAVERMQLARKKAEEELV